MPHRRLATGEAQATGSPAIFTHPTQYLPANETKVDFDRERVVRLAAPQNSGIGFGWIVETEREVLIGVATSIICTALPPPAQQPVDIAIPLSIKPVRVVSYDVGPPCDLGGRG